MNTKKDLILHQDVFAFLKEAWELSEKNAAARSYIAGVLDALNWAGQLDQVQYETAYDKYVCG